MQPDDGVYLAWGVFVGVVGFEQRGGFWRPWSIKRFVLFVLLLLFVRIGYP